MRHTIDFYTTDLNRLIELDEYVAHSYQKFIVHFEELSSLSAMLCEKIEMGMNANSAVLNYEVFCNHSVLELAKKLQTHFEYLGEVVARSPHRDKNVEATTIEASKTTHTAKAKLKQAKGSKKRKAA